MSTNTRLLFVKKTICSKCRNTNIRLWIWIFCFIPSLKIWMEMVMLPQIMWRKNCFGTALYEPRTRDTFMFQDHRRHHDAQHVQSPASPDRQRTEEGHKDTAATGQILWPLHWPPISSAHFWQLGPLKTRIIWGVVGVGTPPRKVGLASASPGFAWGPALGDSQAIFTGAKRCSETFLKYCSGCGVSADEARCLSNCDKRGGG